MNPQISLIIVNYNAGASLKACVLSVGSQCAQIIVVDNASTDDSLDILLRALPDSSNLKIIRNKFNLGFAKACNIGVKVSSGQFLLFLNPDCIFDADDISRLTAVLDKDAQAGMAGGVLVNPDRTEQQGGRRAVPTPWRSFVRASGLWRLAGYFPRLFFDFHLHKKPLPSKPIEVEAISGACMLVKRAAFDDVGPWDDNYFLHCEDLDWCMRFRQRGWKILFVPDAIVLHEKGACSRNRPVFVEWHKHKGMIRFYYKFFRHQYPGLLMWLVAIGVWLRFGGIAAYYCTRHVGRSLGIIRG